jgi:hypothetical protein
MLIILFLGFLFLLNCQMVIINTVAFEQMIPWSGCHILSTIFGPFDVRLVSQNPSTFLFRLANSHERAIIEADPIIKVWIPVDGLLFNGLPSDENVMRSRWTDGKKRYAFWMRWAKAHADRLDPLTNGLPFENETE